MRNIIWFIITLTAISQLSSALTISLDSPGSAGIEEEFSVSYEADSSETFDVKIFVHSSEDTSIQRSEYISEIYDSDWKDSWYYIKEAFPERKEFMMRALNSPGDRSICVRLRKTGTDVVHTECTTIEILEQSQTQTMEQHEEDDEPDEIENNVLEDRDEKIQQLTKPEQSAEQLPKKIQQEKILLNSPKNELSEEITTSSQKKLNWIIYSFLGLCIFIIILLSLKRL